MQGTIGIVGVEAYLQSWHHPCGIECESGSTARTVRQSTSIERAAALVTLALRPSLQMASQSSLDCSEAQGLVNSI